MKLLVSFCIMGFYTGVGVYSSVYEPMQKSNAPTGSSSKPKTPPQQPAGLDIHELESGRGSTGGGGGRGSEGKKLTGHDALGLGRTVQNIKHTVNDKIQANILRRKTVKKIYHKIEERG
jgi:hypothetical protein